MLCSFKNRVTLPVNWQTLDLARYHLFTPLQLLHRSNIICCFPDNFTKVYTITVSSTPANSIERWLYVTDWSASNLHCTTQQSVYPSAMISGLRGKICHFLGGNNKRQHQKLFWKNLQFQIQCNHAVQVHKTLKITSSANSQHLPTCQLKPEVLNTSKKLFV